MMATTRSGSDADRVLIALGDGPATTAEIAAELGMPKKLACAHLNNLRRRGLVATTRFPTGNRRRRNLWVQMEASA